MLILKSPWKVPISKKKSFTLNLNQYRNLHYQSLNKAKVNYTTLMGRQLRNIAKIVNPVYIQYTVYPGTKGRFDIGNICSIHMKFMEDALVHYGILPDDSYLQIPISQFRYGSVSKGNPYVEVRIKEVIPQST